MKYIHAIKGGFIALVIFIIAVIYIPGKGSSEDVQLIFTISSFLFAIFMGFFISRSNSRYEKIKELIADEDAYWLSLYRGSKSIGGEFSKKIANLIDKYYITSFDTTEGFYYKLSLNHLDLIFKEFFSLYNKKNLKLGHFSNSFNFEMLSRIEEDRNKSSVLAQEKITLGQWIVVIALSVIIIFSMFYLKVSYLYSQVITVLLSTILVLVILVLRDLQNLLLVGKSALAESGQEVFEGLGKLRYYNKKFIDNGTMVVPKYVKKYRLGLHKPGEKFNIEIVENK